MRIRDFEAEEDGQHSNDGGSLSRKDFQEETERLRQLEELQRALRNFAKHFGPGELYRQAKAICLETAEGRAAVEQEAAQVMLNGNALKDHNQAVSERQRESATSKRPRNESRKMEEARKALGG